MSRVGYPSSSALHFPGLSTSSAPSLFGPGRVAPGGARRPLSWGRNANGEQHQYCPFFWQLAFVRRDSCSLPVSMASPGQGVLLFQ